MTITLSPETRKLIEDRMKATGLATADEVVRSALLDQIQGGDFEDLDPEVQAGIDQAETEYARGEGIPLDEAFAQIRKRYFGQ